MDLSYLYIMLLGYIIGSIPFGLILSFLFGYGDIRKIGSGNIGATNVLRTGNKKLALATLLLDAGKASLPVYFLLGTFPAFIKPHTLLSFLPPTFLFDTALLFVLGVVLGHCFPIWLKFKGGKGVATALGGLLAAVPYAGLAACAAWLIAAKLTKISSLSALIAIGIAPLVTLFIYGTSPAAICTLITLLVYWRHKENIKRLLNGTEPKIGAKKKDEDAEPVSE